MLTFYDVRCSCSFISKETEVLMCQRTSAFLWLCSVTVFNICHLQVRSAARKRFHRWQEQHSIRARMTQAMSIPTSPSRVSFHSIKQSTSLWKRKPALSYCELWEQPPGVIVILLCRFSGLHWNTFWAGQSDWAGNRLHQSPKPLERRNRDFLEKQMWTEGGCCRNPNMRGLWIKRCSWPSCSVWPGVSGWMYRTLCSSVSFSFFNTFSSSSWEFVALDWAGVHPCGRHTQAESLGVVIFIPNFTVFKLLQSGLVLFFFLFYFDALVFWVWCSCVIPTSPPGKC